LAEDSIKALLNQMMSFHPDLAADGVRAFAAGITGFVTLVETPSQIHRLVRQLAGVESTVLAADFVTAHVGALGGLPGAVLSAGTGAVALGTDFKNTWARVDGWGHLIGDLGGGVWIGMMALQAAAGALDGRQELGSLRLGTRAVKRFGAIETWPAQLYTAGDRAGRIALFADEVAELAADGDVVSQQIITRAGERLASALNAALVDGLGDRAAYTGGLFRLGPSLTGAFQSAFERLRPEVELVPAAGTPLDGAMMLAEGVINGTPVEPHPPLLSVEHHVAC
jgi:N-acetylglucosamine kinase-like BadF-type ATPase